MKVLCDILRHTVYRFVIFCLDKVSPDLPLDQLVSAKYSASFQGATIRSDWKFLILIENPGATAHVWWSKINNQRPGQVKSSEIKYSLKDFCFRNLNTCYLIWTSKIGKSQDYYKAVKPKSPAENLRDPVNGAEQAHQDEEAVPEPQNLQKACFSYVVKICPFFYAVQWCKYNCFFVENNHEDLVVDHVEPEDTEGVLRLLSAARTISEEVILII